MPDDNSAQIKGVAGGNIEEAIMHDMAGGAGFQPNESSLFLGPGL